MAQELCLFARRVNIWNTEVEIICWRKEHKDRQNLPSNPSQVATFPIPISFLSHLWQTIGKCAAYGPRI
ncbi:uncharacterized protein K444DRAFT_613051 [Hyaloscypha bicolor E]|uniref:Uncharacterized protein n=1 Tax=Hyaloscypha bicolor E TaxID=1095630 RepID=A0A2J6TAI0_9HELO|nr:uncharacterized protein K444DRAFT_613051 [Hyaloscypha bicolor E]PMD60019.1 hypothetical protein K444DRAFT_613051 [Hyaloscypha bicolor E]